LAIAIAPGGNYAFQMQNVKKNLANGLSRGRKADALIF
jgi:hypothetical protein